MTVREKYRAKCHAPIVAMEMYQALRAERRKRMGAQRELVAAVGAVDRVVLVRQDARGR